MKSIPLIIRILIRLNRNIQYKNLVSNINKYKPKYQNRIKYRLLDIGCGNGYFLDYAKRFYDVYGLEVDKKRYNVCKERYGNKIFFENINNYKNGKYDIITLLHVIEHIKDYNTTLNKIKSLLNEDGLFLLVTNDNNSSMAKKHGDNWHWAYRKVDKHKYKYDEHISLKGTDEWCGILKEKGFEILKVEYLNKSLLHFLISLPFLKCYNDLVMIIARK